MRQALEAFATFVYKKSIEQVSTDPVILQQLPDKSYTTYFSNLMYRLVLHGGSHREEQVRTIQDINFFNFISHDEKVRTAKDILCFIFLLNEAHVLIHLGNSEDVRQNLLRWCSEIKDRSI